MQKIKATINNITHRHDNSNTNNSGLDRNGDGKVDSRDLNSGRSNTNSSLDRNGDGRVDAKDLTQGSSSLNQGQQQSWEQGQGSWNQQGIPASELENKRALNQELLGKGDTVLHQGEQAWGQGSWNQQGTSQVREAPVNFERVEKEAVVQERLHPIEKEEIQPVVYREREQMDIRQITQQLHETEIQPTVVQQRELAPEYRAPLVERAAPIRENYVAPSVDVSETQRSTTMLAPIVNETIKKTVIEEVQPVVDRDVLMPTLIQQTQPIYEKVVEAPTVYREVLPTRELGIRGLDQGFDREFQQPQQQQQMPLVDKSTLHNELLNKGDSVLHPVQHVEQPLDKSALHDELLNKGDSLLHPVETEQGQQQGLGQQAWQQPITMTTTTTTTDSFIPAKFVQPGYDQTNKKTSKATDSRGSPVPTKMA